MYSGELYNKFILNNHSIVNSHFCSNLTERLNFLNHKKFSPNGYKGKIIVLQSLKTYVEERNVELTKLYFHEKWK